MTASARARMLEVELSDALAERYDLPGYAEAWVLVRAAGVPLGMVRVPVRDGACRGADITTAIERQLDTASAPLAPDPPQTVRSWPSLTVAVCTRGRPDELRECIAHLVALDYPQPELLIIDNAPSDDANAAVCRAWPRVRRIVEPRPGLNWARNRAVLEASGEIIAFTDDDARVDSDWARAIVAPFLSDASVGAVAGLAVPLELDTPAQILFEHYGGVSGGFRRIHLKGRSEWGVRGMWHYALMAQHGSGANMAFRRSVFEGTGPFDVALDVGTPTNGGGDTEMLFRVLAHGFAMVYEPRAIVRHRHRRDYAAVEHQIAGWGSGMYAFLTRSMLAFPKAWWVLGLLGLRGLVLLTARIVRPNDIPRRLLMAQLKGSLTGPFSYVRSRRRSREIERTFGPQSHQGVHG